MKLTRNDLLKNGISEELIKKCESNYISQIHSDKFIVYKFHSAPYYLREVCDHNGGDEDWLVITDKELEWMPSWLERTSADGDLDIYQFDGMVIYVGSHS